MAENVLNDIVSEHYGGIYLVKCRFYIPYVKEHEYDKDESLCGRWYHKCKVFKSIRGLSSHAINNCEGIVKLDYIQYLNYKNIED